MTSVLKFGVVRFHRSRATPGHRKMRDAGDFHAAKRGDAGGDVKQFVRLKTAFWPG